MCPIRSQNKGGIMENLRPLYDSYMKYKHAKSDAERQAAIEELLMIHGFDVLQAEMLLEIDNSRYDE